MIHKTWVQRLAEDVIEINCIDCAEFDKPLKESCCWCPPIVEVVDRELSLMNEYTEENEYEVATAWEIYQSEHVRRKYEKNYG